MRIIKVSEATGKVLDWLVGMAEGYELNLYGVDPSIRARVPGLGVHAPWAPSRYWNQGGPIIERGQICITYPRWDKQATALLIKEEREGRFEVDAPTPLIAAMRCYVASKLGDTAEVPDELCN